MSIERHPDKYRPAHRSKRGNKMRTDRGKGSKFRARLIRLARLKRQALQRTSEGQDDAA